MIRPLTDLKELPWPLLLDADPDRALVESYLKRSRVLVYQEDYIEGVLVFEERADEWEILNVAVSESHQGQGIGGQLLDAAFAWMKKQAPDKRVLIKTGDLTSPALSLYQKKGFQQIAIVKDYFVDNYPEPIYEDGRLLRNQVILAKQL